MQEEKYDLKYSYRATLILASIPLLVMYTEAMLIPSLPTMQRQFNVDEATISWVLSLYLAFGTISAALFGKLGDIYGKKRMMIIALAIYTVGATLTGFAPDFKTLLISRAIQGSGIAIFPLAFSIVREEFPARMIPQIQGIISAMFGIGVLISLPLGAYISQNYGWQATYHSAIPFIVLEDLLVVFFIRESRYKNPQRIDWIGVFLLSSSLMSGIIGVTQAPNNGWLSLQTILSLSYFLISFTLFIFIERNKANPLVPISMLSNRNLIIANFGIFLAGFTFQLMGQAITFIFQMPKPNGYALGLLETGIWMIPNALVQLIAAPIAGRGLFKTGTKFMAIIGSITSSLGFIVLSFIAFIDIPHLVSGMIITSLGTTLINISLINIVIFSVDRKNLGIATGLNTVFRNMGAAWGPAIAGTIMDQFKELMITHNPQTIISVPSHFAYELIFYITASMFTILALLINFTKEVLKNKN